MKTKDEVAEDAAAEKLENAVKCVNSAVTAEDLLNSLEDYADSVELYEKVKVKVDPTYKYRTLYSFQDKKSPDYSPA